MDEDAQMEELRIRAERMQAALDRLQREQPNLPTITYIVMANDIASAERADERLHKGELGWKDAVWMCGSYTRLDYALRWAEEGLLPRDWLLDELPSLWSGSDPDDTDPRFLELWREAWIRNDRRPLVDGLVSLPTRRNLTVYRGQRDGDTFGIAWSLDERVARKFASGASYRAPISDGVLYQGVIPSALVMGYMTGRNEAEVILCPADLLT